MKTNVTRSRTCAAKRAATHAAIFAALTSAAMPAGAQDDVTDTTPSIRDVALTPLSDLNLSRDPIPDILLSARATPYANDGLGTCGAIRHAVGDLDAVLGDDFDTSPPDRRGITVTGVAQRVIGMFIPFRGIIREVSGANSHEYEFREAIAAGLMRRAFLKGKGQEMGCAYPASPAPPELLTRLQTQRETPQAAQSVQSEAVAADDRTTTTFVSDPVIQTIRK